MAIKCCRNCVPPKRYVGCHSTCKQYAEEKAQDAQKKQAFKDATVPMISVKSFIGNHGRGRKKK